MLTWSAMSFMCVPWYWSRMLILYSQSKSRAPSFPSVPLSPFCRLLIKGKWPYHLNAVGRQRRSLVFVIHRSQNRVYGKSSEYVNSLKGFAYIMIAFSFEIMSGIRTAILDSTQSLIRTKSRKNFVTLMLNGLTYHRQPDTCLYYCQIHYQTKVFCFKY